ncbi:MAG: phenylalanine--tRNA ligase subunit alpha [Candidatus Micrarchaeota archaeon]
MILSNIEKKLLIHLAAANSSSILEASKSPDFALSPDSARAAAEKLVHLGLATKENVSKTQLAYTGEGQKAAEEGLAEVRLLKLLEGGSVPISSLEPYLRQFAIAWAKKKGWTQAAAGQLSITPAGEQAAKSASYLTLPKDPAELLNYGPKILEELERRGLVKTSSRVEDTILKITPEGKSQAAKLPEEGAEISLLERQMLISGSWRAKAFAKYDVHSPPPQQLAPRRHPINRLAAQISQIFVQMGFEQMSGSVVESSFWNFDALFQPQDHPARDLADTFYLDGSSPLPNKQLVGAIKNAHESGWGGAWSEQEASREVLRTHTTAVSARTLYENRKNPAPRKFFSIGKVFRNEATDYKHLAEFFQVEGIVSWEGANFSHLLGTLKEFYARLGFDKIRFRPSYFPYTEPSLEVEVFYPQRKEWIELGGAGILRPEVTIPLCSKYPVLAWGLSLERPLMLAGEISDIRTFYRNDLNWLRTFKIRP